MDLNLLQIDIYLKEIVKQKNCKIFIYSSENVINPIKLRSNMTTTVEIIKKELIHIRKDLDFIKDVLREEFELSTHAKKTLREARETPESEYIDLE